MKKLQALITEATADRTAAAEAMRAVAGAFQSAAKSALEVYGAEVGSSSDRLAFRREIDAVTARLQSIQLKLEG